jgi:hypothetical protein
MSDRHTKPGCFLTAVPLIGLLLTLSWVVL